MNKQSKTQKNDTHIMEVRNDFNSFFHYCQLLLLLLLLMALGAFGFGSTGPISAAFGEDGFFCAIDASGEQEIICWKNNSSSSSAAYFSSLLPMAALSGGEGFMCGIVANTSQAYCWDSNKSGTDLVPAIFRTTAYSQIAAGLNHVCAIRGSYYSNIDSGIVDCWELSRNSNNTLVSIYSSSFSDPSTNNLVFRKIVSGEGFTCGGVREGGIACWGPKSANLGVSSISENFMALASGRDSVCGISEVSGEVKCWGKSDSFKDTPVRIRFVFLASGARHFCGIREDDHAIQCWGSINVSSVPKGSGFLGIASSDFITCGVKEDDLLLDCWGVNVPLLRNYTPPLQLCSPGLCKPGSCGEGKFAFNGSILGVPDLSSLCIRKDLKICSPCGINCSDGFFLSSECSENADRVCAACSLCQNSSCSHTCKLHSSLGFQSERKRKMMELVIIIGSCVSGFALFVIGWCVLPRMIKYRKEEQEKSQCRSCIGKPEVEAGTTVDSVPSLSTTPSIGTTQVFRLSELKDATNGFKEFNELGRGSYGFVYKAILPDGRQVAVKRANAATIIHTNSRDFEAELEILCKIRHSNIVNLLGYCAEMGERLLVYEFMPHGTLHDHLHGELSPLTWNLRLKISMQAARGLDYLHKDATPPIVHRDIKTSNILLDSEWVARIADFGLMCTSDKELNGDVKSDVYNFGIVLLEILSGRKAYDKDYVPPSIVHWAVPLIREGKAAAIIDRNVALPRNVEPLLKLADIAELALKEDPGERPAMSDISVWLKQIVKIRLTM